MQAYMNACMQQGRRYGFESRETKSANANEKKTTPTFNYHAMGYMTKGKIYLNLPLHVGSDIQKAIETHILHARSASPLILSVSRFSCPPVLYICTNTFRKCGDRFPPAAPESKQQHISSCRTRSMNATRLCLI